MPINWTTSQITMDALYGTRKASLWGTETTSSVLGQGQQKKNAPTSTYFTKPTPQPFYTVTNLGPASPFVDMMPLSIQQGRDKYGYNVLGSIPLVGATSVDVFKLEEGETTKVKTEKMTTEQAAAVYAPVQAGKKDEFKDMRDYYSGMKLDSAKTESNYYQNVFAEKFKAGTWWGR